MMFRILLAVLCIVPAASGKEIENMNKLRHRMGTLVISGTSGTKVKVTQTKHAFPFGTAISSKVFKGEIARRDRNKYLDTLKTYFNYAVHENALKWYGTRPEQKKKANYKKADRMLDWCLENGIPMRGHCLFWAVPTFVQSWVRKLDDADLRAAVEKRAYEVTSRYKGKIDEFDLNNEMVHGDFYRGKLGPEIIGVMARKAKEGNPDVVLYVNDYNILSGKDLDPYIAQIESLIATGVPIGGIGCQAHFGKRVPLDDVKRSLDRLAALGLPIRITEFDQKTLNEEDKARDLEAFYRVCFEHYAVNGILQWGFWAGRHWLTAKQWGLKGYTALWDKKWNPMPAGIAYTDLVYGEWWTDEEVEIGASGMTEISVFLGDFTLTGPGGDKKVSLTTAGQEVTIAF